jgi:DNA-binding transcriptional LysR family regulator
MLRTGLDDLNALAVVAREQSFTRAAAILGVPQSSLSRTIRALEERHGVRLLARTTRSVAPTEAGENLLRGIRPALEAIEAELLSLGSLSGRPSGTVRITAVRHAFEMVLRPILPSFLASYPEISVEVSINDGFTDIVAERFDAGIRFGGLIEKDMIALRVGPDFRAAVVATPEYLTTHAMPQTPHDLTEHRCINYRMTSSGGLYPWRFERNGQAIDVRVEGSVTLNDGDAILSAALDGLGVAYLFLDTVQDHLASGRLVSLLSDWCPAFPGYHIYHPSRRHTPPSLAALIQVMRPRRNA